MRGSKCWIGSIDEFFGLSFMDVCWFYGLNFLTVDVNQSCWKWFIKFISFFLNISIQITLTLIIMSMTVCIRFPFAFKNIFIWSFSLTLWLLFTLATLFFGIIWKTSWPLTMSWPLLALYFVKAHLNCIFFLRFSDFEFKLQFDWWMTLLCLSIHPWVVRNDEGNVICNKKSNQILD